ncbi:Hypothetical predicted protein [Mytilus galloprovincialis]|uniref:C2H2-type domain-containing protein n=3 Tax=Mytilus galloprovincialis TaxID=29158 RepID=A0A8B6F9A4_MYTGA|nr:Hypothetical predicted protein [Mytilus galloprovincialis]
MNLNNDKTMLDYLGVQVLTSDSDITDLITSADLLEEQEDPNNPIEPNPKKCNVCHKEFTEKCNLSRHMKKHLDKMEKCQQCDKVFYTKCDLSCHVDSFHKHIVFQCTTCQKSFKSKTGLSNHNREHSGQFRYLCTYCGKGFNYKRQFEGHKAGHENERNFSCSKCGKSFQYENSRYNHAKLCGINKEKYVKCDQCGKAFKCIKYMKEHQKCHLNPDRYQCAMCGNYYQNRSGLHKHVKKTGHN